MSTMVVAPPPLTIQDLMARWGVSEATIKEHIHHGGLPFWDAGTGRGRRPDYRFRLADVESWEAARVRTKAAPEVQKTHEIPAGAPGGWDGKSRLKRGR